MAVLSGKTTSGKPAWEVYVLSNPEWKKLDLEIENKMTTYVYKKTAKIFKPTEVLLKAGDKLRLLSEKLVKDSLNEEYASIITVKGANKGYVLIKRIRKPSGKDTLKDETVALKAIDNLVKSKGFPIDVIIMHQGKSFFTGKNIVGARTINGTPKADFALYDNTGKNQIFISHKKAGGPSAFQQYSGVSPSSGDVINKHKEVVEFMRKATDFVEKNKLQRPLWHKIKSKELINYAIYGPHWSKSKIFDEEHCQIIGQGDPILKPTRNERAFQLEWSDHMGVSGDVSVFSGGYTPVIGATFRAGRKFEIDGITYTGARLGIMPKDLVANRSGAVEI